MNNDIIQNAKWTTMYLLDKNSNNGPENYTNYIVFN